MLQLAEEQKLSPQNVEGLLMEDLDMLHQIINQSRPMTRSIKLCRSEGLAAGLKTAYEMHKKLDADSQRQCQELLRLFIFSIQRHKDKIVVPTSSGSDPDPLDVIMEFISSQIGVIPTQFSPPELPRAEFLPKKFENQKETWKEKPCHNPSRRATSIDSGKIDFIKKNNKASVRLQLEEDAKNQENHSLSVSDAAGKAQDFYLNLVDFEYYKLGLMHADHLLPSESMLRRLKEVVKALNHDKKFREDIGLENFSDYFIEEAAKEGISIVGNYWYYIAHHNSMENLWFLLASDNSTDGKLATDPVEWLGTRDIGRLYLDQLVEEGKFIDRSYILYKVINKETSQKESLKDSFINFVKNNKKKILEACKDLAFFHQTSREMVVSTDGPHPQAKLRSSSTRRAGLFMAGKSLIKDIADDTSESSIGSENRVEYDERYALALETNPRAREMREEIFACMHTESRRIKQALLAGTSSSVVQFDAQDGHDNVHGDFGI